MWRVWLGINDTNIPVERALGTYVELHPDGHAEVITLRPDGEEQYTIMEANHA